MFINNRKIWKTVYFLCILFLKRSLSASLCCIVHEIFISNKCTEETGYIRGYSASGVFSCVIRSKTYQETIKEFSIGTFHSKEDDKNRCFYELVSWENRNGSSSEFHALVATWNLYVMTLTINTDEHTELSDLNTIPRLMPNITELSWDMHTSCQRVNDFIAKLKRLKVLSFDIRRSVDLNKCVNFSFNSPTQLTKLEINFSQFSVTSANLKRYAFKPTIFDHLKSLEEFKLNCGSELFEVDLPMEMFQGITNLSKLTLEHCSFNKFSAAHFQTLTNLRTLKLSYARFDDFQWLR